MGERQPSLAYGGDSNTTPVPGPTLEASVEIAFNLRFSTRWTSRVSRSLDRHEEGRDNGCDQSSLTDASLAVTVAELVSGRRSIPELPARLSTANLHFHGHTPRRTRWETTY